MSTSDKQECDSTGSPLMSLRSGKRVSSSRSSYIGLSSFSPPCRDTTELRSSCSEESLENDTNNFEDISSEMKEENKPDLDCNDQDYHLGSSQPYGVVIGEIVPMSWFNAEQYAGSHLFDKTDKQVKQDAAVARQKKKNNKKKISHRQRGLFRGSSSRLRRFVTRQNQSKMKLRSGKLINCRPVVCSQQQGMKTRSSKSGAGQLEMSLPSCTSVSDQKSANNEMQSLEDFLVEVKQECSYTFDDYSDSGTSDFTCHNFVRQQSLACEKPTANMLFLPHSDVADDSQDIAAPPSGGMDSDDAQQRQSAITCEHTTDDPLLLILPSSPVPAAEAVFSKVFDVVPSIIDELSSMPNHLPSNVSQLAYDGIGCAADMELLSGSFPTSIATRCLSDDEYILTKTPTESCVREQASDEALENLMSLLHDIGNHGFLSQPDKMPYDENGVRFDLTELPSAADDYGQLQVSDDSLEFPRLPLFPPGTGYHRDTSPSDETLYDDSENGDNERGLVELSSTLCGYDKLVSTDDHMSLSTGNEYHRDTSPYDETLYDDNENGDRLEPDNERGLVELSSTLCDYENLTAADDALDDHRSLPPGTGHHRDNSQSDVMLCDDNENEDRLEPDNEHGLVELPPLDDYRSIPSGTGDQTDQSAGSDTLLCQVNF